MLSEIRAKLRTKRGFTLMEILIVIAIIAVLSVAFLPNALGAPKKARDAGRIKKVQDLQTAVEAFAAERGEAPGSSVANAGCLDTGLATLLGITLPVDASNLKSCSDDPLKANWYLYKYDGGLRVYVIGMKLEVKSSANSKEGIDIPGDVVFPADDGDDSTDKVTEARNALIETSKDGVKGDYFLAIGPV